MLMHCNDLIKGMHSKICCFQKGDNTDTTDISLSICKILSQKRLAMWAQATNSKYQNHKHEKFNLKL